MKKDALDEKVLEVFAGKVVRKDLLHRIKKGTNVPTFVLEFFLARFCASDDPDEIKAGTEAVLETLRENYVRPDEANAAQSRVATHGKHRFIDKIHVRYVEKDKRHWAALENFNSQKVSISEKFFTDNSRMLEGGIWAEVTVAHNELDDEFAFYVDDVRPIQLGRFDFEGYCEGRKQFTRDEWLSTVLRAVGLEPSAIDHRVKMHFLLRLAPLVEQNYNFIELGPRGTGKSYFYSEFSPYSTLVSGGQASKATLFYNNARHRVGLVGFWDNVAFDEVAGIRIRDPEAIQIMKDFMANGRFSRGTEIIADASLSFVGNIDESVEQLVNSPEHDLFVSLPKELDLAVMDRFACYLPGWEMPKNSSSFLTNNYGLITDYLAEAFHHCFASTNRYEEVSRRIKLGSSIEGRDEKGVKKTVCAYLKMLHPDGPPSNEEFDEYVAYAVEMRRRVKEQMNKRKPDDEFANINLSFFDNDGKEVVVYCPESKHLSETGQPTPPTDGTGKESNPPDNTEAILETFQGYELLECFETAGMAEVYKAKKSGSDQHVFLKRVHVQSSDIDALQREMAIYQKLSGMETSHVLQVLDSLRDDDYIAIVTEFAEDGDLEDFVRGKGGGLSVGLAQEIALAIARGLEELHAVDVVHRDLKPRNVLKHRGDWMIADFGISKNLARVVTQKTFQNYGTLGYAAPEQFDGVEAKPSADIYSLGKIMVFLLTGQTDIDFITYPAWRELIKRCVDPAPANRPALSELIASVEEIPT